MYSGVLTKLPDNSDTLCLCLTAPPSPDDQNISVITCEVLWLNQDFVSMVLNTSTVQDLDVLYAERDNYMQSTAIACKILCSFGECSLFCQAAQLVKVLSKSVFVFFVADTS